MATQLGKPELAPFFRRLDKLVVDSTPTFRNFADLITKSGKDNDLTETLRNLPKLANVTETVQVSAEALQIDPSRAGAGGNIPNVIKEVLPTIQRSM